MELESYGGEDEYIGGRTAMPNGDLRDIWEKVSKLTEKGCALRDGDIERMARIEKQNDRIHARLDWITVLMIGNLAALAANLAKIWLVK
jgi:hypothetical protein